MVFFEMSIMPLGINRTLLAHYTSESSLHSRSEWTHLIHVIGMYESKVIS